MPWNHARHLSLLQEPDDAPSAVHISGLAGNASDSLWGIRFIGTRIATFEAFRMRLGNSSRVSLINTHIEGRNGRRMDTSGRSINTGDNSIISYGDITGLPSTDDLRIYGSPRESPNDGISPHYYGGSLHIETDRGDVYSSGGIYFGFEEINTGIYHGASLPDRRVAALPGSLYFRDDGSSLGGLYLKLEGGGKDGWFPVFSHDESSSQAPEFKFVEVDYLHRKLNREQLGKVVYFNLSLEVFPINCFNQRLLPISPPYSSRYINTLAFSTTKFLSNNTK